MRNRIFIYASYLSDRVFDHLFVRHIALVTHEKLVDTFGSVAVNLLKPLLHIVEAVHVGDIINDTDAVGAAVVGRGNGTKAFLASSVPLTGGHS